MSKQSKQSHRAVNGHSKSTIADLGTASMEFIEFDAAVIVARRAIGAIDALRIHISHRGSEISGLNPENKFRVRYLIDLLKCEVEDLIRDQVSDSVSKIESVIVNDQLKPIGTNEVLAGE